jgi:multidrug efflux pump subunit AcrB
MGKTPLQAALDGASEIGFTILSISIALVAVFIPLLLMSGMVRRMFQEFAVTVTVAIAVSVIVSLTLTPMLGARLLREQNPENAGKLSCTLERCFEALVAGYGRVLVVALQYRFGRLLVMLATVAMTGWLFIVIPKGFFPEQDTGLILGVTEAAQDVSPNGLADMQQRMIATVETAPRRRIRRSLYRCRGSHIDREAGSRVHCLEATWRAASDRQGDGAHRPQCTKRDRYAAVHAAGSGRQHRRPSDRGAIPVNVK